MVKVHINTTKPITISNIYIPPRDSTSTHYKQLTRTYNTTCITSQTYHTQSSPKMLKHTRLSGTRTLVTIKDSRCHQQLILYYTKHRHTNQTPHYNKHLHQISPLALCSFQILQNIKVIWTLKIKHTSLPMKTHPKVLGLTLDPNLTYSTHIPNISVHIHKPLQIITVLTATAWG